MPNATFHFQFPISNFFLSCFLSFAIPQRTLYVGRGQNSWCRCLAIDEMDSDNETGEDDTTTTTTNLDNKESDNVTTVEVLGPEVVGGGKLAAPTLLPAKPQSNANANAKHEHKHKHRFAFHEVSSHDAFLARNRRRLHQVSE